MSKVFTGTFNSQPNQNSTYLASQLAGTNGRITASTSGSSSTSAFYQPSQENLIQASPAEPISIRKAVNDKRTPGEIECMNETFNRLTSRLAHDQSRVSHPDVDSPFVDQLDVINRLLPYHILQQPKNDLDTIISGKGKEKAVEDNWREEIQSTKLALECFQRRKAVCERWRKLKVRSGKRAAPDDQAYYLAQVVLDADRSENAWLGNELRTVRAESERIEREKRVAANAARITHFPSAPQAVMPTLQPQYYRPYPYAYTQAYGSAPAPTISTFSVSPATSSNYAPYQSSGAIPVQLPVASLPALHALGIVPVPVSSLPLEGQPQPPAVLRGSSANGTILSLEINVSLLQSAQMSGLAMVLNSLVSRSNAASAVPTGSITSSPSIPVVTKSTEPLSRNE